MNKSRFNSWSFIETKFHFNVVRIFIIFALISLCLMQVCTYVSQLHIHDLLMYEAPNLVYVAQTWLGATAATL